MANDQQLTKKEREALHHKIRKDTVGYILAAFGIIAGLAWNDAVKSLIEYLVPLSGNTLMLKFSYALIITLIVVLVSNYLSRLTEER